jgi:hypothetical protein
MVGNILLSVLAVFTFTGIVTRYPSARSPYDFSLVPLCTIMLGIFAGFKVAALFGFGIYWLARRWNPMEELSYTICFSLSVLVGALSLHWLVPMAHGNLVTLAIYFTLVQYGVYSLVITPITRPATLVSDFIFNACQFVFFIIFTSVILYLFGNPILHTLGITGWESGSIGQVIEFLLPG